MEFVKKEELVDAILKENSGISKNLASDVYKTLFDTIIKSCAEGKAVVISGFGRFEAVKREAREGTNPNTGEKINIPARRHVRFHAGDTFRKAVAEVR